MIPKLTGNLLRAVRALAGFTRDKLADRAGLSRDVLRSWEVSSAAIVPAQYQMLCRAIEALEEAGVVGRRRRQAVVARYGEQAMGADHGCPRQA